MLGQILHATILKGRWPRFAHSAEVIAARAKADRLAALDAKAFDWIARGRAANRELGRIFNEIKSILKHGEWEVYFAKKFAPRGIALRTAEVYMRMDSDAERASIADSALFPPATDPQAQAISNAAQNARVEVATADEQLAEKSKSKRKTRVRRDGIYKLLLHMTGHEMAVTDELRDSRNWTDAELEIIALLQQLHIRYVTNSGVTDTAHTGDVFEKKADDEGPLAYA